MIPTKKGEKDKRKKPRPYAKMTSSMMWAFKSTSSSILKFIEKKVTIGDKGNESMIRMVDVQEKRLKFEQ
jgi:hypothetical protein